MSKSLISIHMKCTYCKDDSRSIFAKLGRCKRCMVQLTVLNFILWPTWYWGFSNEPSSVSSVALLFAGGACFSLLALHLLIMPFREPLEEEKKPVIKINTIKMK